MIQYFKNLNHQTVEVDHARDGDWINILPPLKQQEFTGLSEELDIPLDFLTDSLDIDERALFEEEDKVNLIVFKTPTENYSFNESVAYYITVPIWNYLTNNQIVTVDSVENDTNNDSLEASKNRAPDKK